MDKLMLPSVLIETVKQLNFIFKIAEGWRDVNNNDIPGRYFVPRLPYNAATTNKTLITNIWAEQGELKNHCQKFGIKLEQFNPEIMKPRIIGLNSEDGIAYFQHTRFMCRNGIASANSVYLPAYDYENNGGEGKRWWFKEDPNESPLNYLMPFFQGYESTYNKYGGAMCGVSLIPTGADMGFVGCKFTESDEMLGYTLAQKIDTVKQFLACWESHGVLGFELTGTGPSNFDIDLNNVQMSWPRSTDLELFYGTGIDETSKDETFLSYLIELMF
jgi:hypothetical protein